MGLEGRRPEGASLVFVVGYTTGEWLHCKVYGIESVCR